MKSAAQRNWQSHSGGSARRTARSSAPTPASSGSGRSLMLTSSTKSFTASRVGTPSRWTRIAFSPWGEKTTP